MFHCIFLYVLAISATNAEKFSCTGTTDSKEQGLKVVIGPDVNKDWCENQGATDTVEDTTKICHDFCGLENIPLVIGVKEHGFTLQDMDSICLNTDVSGLIIHNQSLLTQCKDWSKSLGIISRQMAKFVAAYDNMTYTQLEFRAGMEEKVQDMITTLTSSDTINTVMAADVHAQLSTYMEVLSAQVSDFFANGKNRRAFVKAMAHLRVQGTKLQNTLRQQLSNFKRFITECGGVFTGVNSKGEYMLDVCNQITSNCLEPADTDARHIGCCCGTVPFTDNFEISGEVPTRRMLLEIEAESIPSTPSTSSIPSTRKKSGGDDIDVCGEAQIKAKADVDASRRNLESSEVGRAVLLAHDEGMERTYPAFHSRCENSPRRLRGVRDADAVPTRKESLRGVRETDAVPMRKESPLPPVQVRRLQKLTTCEPQRTSGNTAEDLRVAFSNETETDHCNMIGDADSLAETCKAFCGKDSVPIVLGSTAFGFNQSAMDSVCVGSSNDLIQADAALVQQCHDDAQAMQAVTKKSAALVARIKELQAEKIRFNVKASLATDTLKNSLIDNAATKIQDAAAGQKIDALQQLIQEGISDLTGGGSVARMNLKAAVDAVDAASVQLEASLSKGLEGLDRLVSQCGRLFTGVGQHKEYLLDMCAVTGQECVESKEARHAGCCCGYTPLLAVSTTETVEVATIPGMRATAALGDMDTTDARVATRRLESQTPTYDICADAWESSRAVLGEIERSLTDIDKFQEIENYNNDLKTKYPDFYCGDKGAVTPKKGYAEAGAKQQKIWLVLIVSCLASWRTATPFY